MAHCESGCGPLRVRVVLYDAKTATRITAFLASCAVALLPFRIQAQSPTFRSALSFSGGMIDAAGHFTGGTEIRALVAQDGRLFAGNGFWKDKPGSIATPGAQLLVLDGPHATWRLDHAFDDVLPGGRRRHLAVSALADVTFRSDDHGRALAAPHTVLLASTWDVSGARTVFVRDAATASWSGTVLAQDVPTVAFLPQIRSFGAHRDAGTGADLVFAGDTRGIFVGWADPGAPGGVRWGGSPELAAMPAMEVGPGLAGRLRISSFAEARGKLFAAIGQQVWVREDGNRPGWRLFYSNPAPFYSQSGLRGLTATIEQGREVLLAAVEGNRSRIVRIDAETASDTTDLDLNGFLNQSWGSRVSYVVAAYNDMPRVAAPDGQALLIGLEAFIPPGSPRPPGHTVLDVNNGLEAGAWFLLRHPGGRYELREVRLDGELARRPLVAVRVAIASPFRSEPGVIYLGGYDANDVAAHDTAWITRSR